MKRVAKRYGEVARYVRCNDDTLVHDYELAVYAVPGRAWLCFVRDGAVLAEFGGKGMRDFAKKLNEAIERSEKP